MRRSELPRESSPRLGGCAPARLAGPGVLVLLVLVSFAAVGCDGGGNGDGITDTSVQFVESGTPSQPDLVRLTGERIDDGTVQVNVVIGGPTTDRKLTGFIFDLVLSDGEVATYVDGSAVCGDALQLTAQQCLAEAGQTADRVAVGVFKFPAPPGNQVRDAEKTVVSLRFLVESGETTLTFDGSPGNPLRPADVPTAFVVEAEANAVPYATTNVSFDTAPAMIRR